MAELEIDQTNLPRVQEVCQCFAVLEDGALAHNLQEQEIEQYYSTNIQKNQLVQNDIRVAKQLQDEEEEHWAQQSALIRQASRQIEERDFEYARVIQEEILRHAEEAQRREQDDEEIAKRMQEEEKRRIKMRSRGHEGRDGGSVREQHSLSSSSSSSEGEELCSSSASRWHCPPSRRHSQDCSEPPRAESPRRRAPHANTTSRSSQGHRRSFRAARSETRERLSEDSEDSDAVFSEHTSASSQRRRTTPPRRWTSLHEPKQRKYRSLCSRSSFTDGGWGEQRGQRDEGYYENSDRDKRRPWVWDGDMELRGDSEGFHRVRGQDPEVRERRCSRSESVRLPERSRQGSRARTWSCRDNQDKHVRFQEDGRTAGGGGGDRDVWEMLGHVLMERGVPVKFGSNGAPLQIQLHRRDSQAFQGSEASCADAQPPPAAFHRAASARHSFHGDVRERRRPSHREHSGTDQTEERQRYGNIARPDGEVYRISRRDSCLASRERGGSRRWREHRRPGDGERETSSDGPRVRRTTSERRHWHRTIEERLSCEEEQEAQERGEQPRRRAPQRSQSLGSSSSSRASTRDRSLYMAAGASVQPALPEESLDMGVLQQVIEDEELARKLQEEEDKQQRRRSQPSPRGSYPQGDFRVAQVAQDEEIAHFMQKQEIKSKRRSRELEALASWREQRAAGGHHDRRATRDRQMPRERLDSEGLPSPTEDCSPDNQPPSPTTIQQAHQIRNIAEELDPTFQARRQGSDSLRAGQSGPLPTASSDFLEEPTFIPPTKRQTDKPGRTKPKDKKENCKQQ